MARYEERNAGCNDGTPAEGASVTTDAPGASQWASRLPASIVRAFPRTGDGRFFLAYLPAGSGMLGVSGRRIAVSAPAALMLTDGEAATASFDPPLPMIAVSFLPAFIHSRFTAGTPAEGVSDLDLAGRFEADALGPFVRLPRPEAGILRLTPPETPALARMFDDLSIVSRDLRARYAPCRFRSCLLSMVHYLGYRSADPVPVYADSPLSPVLLFLQSNYTRAVTLEELCSAFATNRTTLTKRFRAETGMTIGEYLAMLRIRLAESMLEETSLPVSEIASRCGYADATHFGRMFRARTGRSPGTLRKTRQTPAGADALQDGRS